MNNLTKVIEEALPHSKLITIERMGSKTVVTIEPKNVGQQEKPRYWKCVGGYVNFEIGKVYPENYVAANSAEFDIKTVVEALSGFPEEWQPATEAEYLAQEAAKTQRPDTSISNLTEPPKFNPLTADKTKMYYAVDPEFGEGVVHCREGEWQFDSSEWTCMSITDLTHIDHEPITRRN